VAILTSIHDAAKHGIPPHIRKSAQYGLNIARRSGSFPSRRLNPRRLEVVMRGTFTRSVVVAAFAVAVLSAGRLQATPASGFVGVTIVKGTFGDINVFNSVVPPDFWKSWVKSDVWLSWQRTVGNSDLYIQSNTWQVAATTGWHSHPGHSLIVITSGTVTNYESGQRHTCSAQVYTATPENPATLVDEGGDHVHQIVNTGATVATGYAVQLIPAGALRRIDAAQPDNCPF
jgi:hypothetical protein